MKTIGHKLIATGAIIASLAMIGSGCATGQVTWGPEERAMITNRAFPFAYEMVFDAVLRTFEDNGYPIINIDKKNGLVNTDYKSAGAVLFGTGKVKMSARIIKEEDNITRVNLNIHFEGYSDTFGVAMTDDLIKKKDYEKTFNAILKRIKQ